MRGGIDSMVGDKSASNSCGANTAGSVSLSDNHFQSKVPLSIDWTSGTNFNPLTNASQAGRKPTPRAPPGATMSRMRSPPGSTGKIALSGSGFLLAAWIWLIPE